MHLSEFMAEKNLSDGDVATAIGRSRVSVSRYRRRIEAPSWDVIERICEFSGGLVMPNDWLARAPETREIAQ